MTSDLPIVSLRCLDYMPEMSLKKSFAYHFAAFVRQNYQIRAIKFTVSHGIVVSLTEITKIW